MYLHLVEKNKEIQKDPNKTITPYPPNFKSMAAKKIEPIVGASTCALGNHICTENIGILTKKVIIIIAIGILFRIIEVFIVKIRLFWSIFTITIKHGILKNIKEVLLFCILEVKRKKTN